MEALLRWRHPARGWIYPDAFIHVARETEVIKPLTLYVLEEALRQAEAWRAEGTELTIAVNIATRNLLDVEFPGQVAALLARSEVRRGRAPARADRVDDLRQPVPDQARGRGAGRARRRAVDRRLRDRLLVRWPT